MPRSAWPSPPCFRNSPSPERLAARRPHSRGGCARRAVWKLIGDVTQPVFAGGTLLHTKRAADPALRQAAAQYQSTVLTAYRERRRHAARGARRCRCVGRGATAAHAPRKATLDLMHQRMEKRLYRLLSRISRRGSRTAGIASAERRPGDPFGDTAALYQALGGGWWNRKTALVSDDDDGGGGGVVAHGHCGTLKCHGRRLLR